MKINKIICDVCDAEIDVNSDEAIAQFESIQVRTKINLAPDLIPKIDPQSENKIESNRELIKTSFDLCKTCAEETEVFLKTKKEEKHNLTLDLDGKDDVKNEKER